MEKSLKIKTPDNKFISGTLGIGDKKSDTLIIFVHGFTGHSNEHIFFNGSKFLTSKGYDTFRFNLYAGEGNNTRHFSDTSITLHAKDIDAVVKYFDNKYKKIFVAGHSHGGTSLLFTNQEKIDGYVFWDASYINTKDSISNMKFNKNINKYILDYGIEMIVGQKFVEELKNFPDCGELIKKIKKPILIITAGEKTNSGSGIKYFKSANNPKTLVNIKSADHNFNKWKDEEGLLRETYSWLKSNK